MKKFLRMMFVFAAVFTSVYSMENGKEITNNLISKVDKSRSSDVSDSTTDEWLYVGFKDPGNKGIWFSLGKDGLKWTEVRPNNIPWIQTTTAIGTMRDPFITRDPKNGFHLVWTVGNQKIGYGFSTDLVKWTIRTIPIFQNNPNCANVWAPELVYEESTGDWYIFWSSTINGDFPETVGQVNNGKNHRIYYCTTKNFETFSDPKLFYNPGFPVIDASIYKENGTYYMCIKDERDIPVRKLIQITSAKSILGPWSPLSDPLTVSWNEGPSLIKIDSTYIMYFDHYQSPTGMQAIKSKDLKTWTNITSLLSFPSLSKHGSFLRITKQEADRLRSVYATDIKKEDSHGSIPSLFKLYQNYPNPFNPSTEVSYELSEPSHVSLKVFSQLGNEVATLVNEYKTPGFYKTIFDNNVFKTKSLASGVYYYTLRAGGYSSTKKMVLIK